jgi:hypothetical protein
MNVLYECDGMTVCTTKYLNKQKEWHYATKPLSVHRDLEPFHILLTLKLSWLMAG